MARRLFPAALLVGLFGVAGCSDDQTAAPMGTSAPRAEPVAAPVPHHVGTAEQIDDGAAVPGFSAFRETLRGIVARRDTAALLEIVAPTARLSYGDDPGGPDGFRAMWFSGTPSGGDAVWEVLSRVLTGGSVDEDGAVTVPAVGGYVPEGLDPFATVAVVRDRVPARVSATDTTLVGTVGHAYLPVRGPVADGVWTVTLPDGQTAAVAAADALSPVGYRAVFWDEGAGWQLHTFLQGD